MAATGTVNGRPMTPEETAFIDQRVGLGAKDVGQRMGLAGAGIGAGLGLASGALYYLLNKDKKKSLAKPLAIGAGAGALALGLPGYAAGSVLGGLGGASTGALGVGIHDSFDKLVGKPTPLPK